MVSYLASFTREISQTALHSKCFRPRKEGRCVLGRERDRRELGNNSRAAKAWDLRIFFSKRLYSLQPSHLNSHQAWAGETAAKQLLRTPLPLTTAAPALRAPLHTGSQGWVGASVRGMAGEGIALLSEEKHTAANLHSLSLLPWSPGRSGSREKLTVGFASAKKHWAPSSPRPAHVSSC